MPEMVTKIAPSQRQKPPGVTGRSDLDRQSILHRFPKCPTRRWTTPGGRVESGESPLDALKRAVLEETGLNVTSGELLGVYAKPHEDDLVLSFRARVISRTAWQPNDEIVELGYFGRDELPDPMSVAARTRVLDAFEGRVSVFRVVGISTE